MTSPEPAPTVTGKPRDINFEGERIANDTWRHPSGNYLWTDLVGAIQTGIFEERERNKVAWNTLIRRLSSDTESSVGAYAADLLKLVADVFATPPDPAAHEGQADVVVIQADREAAAHPLLLSVSQHTADYIKAGKLDCHNNVQAFARHRLSSLRQQAGEVEAWHIAWQEGANKAGELLARATKAEAENARLEEERAEQWRLRRDAESSRDVARAACDTLREENARLMEALERIAKQADDVTPTEGFEEQIAWIEAELDDEPNRLPYGDDEQPPCRNGYEVSELIAEHAGLVARQALRQALRQAREAEGA
jgi:hypothetical protein